MERRVYGCEPGDPGPVPGHAYVELVGGPLDGLLLDVTGWDPKDIVDGAVLMSDHGVFGPAGRHPVWARTDPVDSHRAVATRYDKLAVRYHAIVLMAAINEWL
ncbi:hypothetical protein [Streptomyces goshikiensis]|uniref:hypothetical protein n=1 Tax=Streptomyces TaxID=1883 RepID=UPI00369D207F